MLTYERSRSPTAGQQRRRAAFPSRHHVSAATRRRGIVILALLLAAPAGALTGTHGMIAAEHRLASQAGLRILQEGGNAVDAAVATALAVGVVNPTSCGIGGGGFMLIYDHATRRVAALDYRETAPGAASRDMFVRDGTAVPELSLHSGLAVATPGEIAGLFAALRRHPSAATRARSITVISNAAVISSNILPVSVSSRRSTSSARSDCQSRG